jgi:MFS family permease
MRWVHQLKVFGAAGGDWKSAMACLPQMLLCLGNPLIFWVVFLNAVNFGGSMSIFMTFPTLLTSEPYNLTTSVLSFIHLAAAGGSLLAWPASSITINRITKRLATQNCGVRHAEHILPGYILPILAGAGSVILYGFIAQHRYHYLWAYLAVALNSFAFAGMSVANTLWATEVFPRWAAAALAAVGGASYIASFGISAALRPWLEAQGYFWVNLILGIIMLVLGFVAVPIAFWGKGIRQYISGRWGAYEAGALRPQ